MTSNLGEIARVIDAELRGAADCPITGVGTLENAVEGQLSFLANPRYIQYLTSTRASAVVLSAVHADDCPVSCLVAEDPYLAYVRAVRYLNPDPVIEPGIHPSAVVDDSAFIHATARVSANCSIGRNVRLDEGVYLGPGCVIEDNVSIGKSSRLSANISLCHDVIIGQRCEIHPGVVIGGDGFGLANDGGEWLKIPQLGSVEIMDDVEIGANTAIDRGALENTRIESGVKIDNLVQIGHNVVIGAHTAIAGCAVIAGSVTIGRRCMIGGATAIAGHISITDDVVITGLSGVTNSIRKAGMYSGAMTITDSRTWRKNMARFRHLDELVRRVNELEQRLENTKSDRE